MRTKWVYEIIQTLDTFNNALPSIICASVVLSCRVSSAVVIHVPITYIRKEKRIRELFFTFVENQDFVINSKKLFKVFFRLGHSMDAKKVDYESTQASFLGTCAGE